MEKLYGLVHGPAALPPARAPESLALYLADHADGGLKPASLGRVLAALVQGHRAAGYPSPRTAAVQAVWQGIAADGIAPVQKAPLAIEQLRAMVVWLGNRPIAVHGGALLLVGFAGAQRLVPANRGVNRRPWAVRRPWAA